MYLEIWLDSYTDKDDELRPPFALIYKKVEAIARYPAAKIGRFAVDANMKGKNIGSILLDFIKRYFTADNKTGCHIITVDANAAAIPFYLRNGFVPPQ